MVDTLHHLDGNNPVAHQLDGNNQVVHQVDGHPVVVVATHPVVTAVPGTTAGTK